jgi:hypothetical protein
MDDILRLDALAFFHQTRPRRDVTNELIREMGEIVSAASRTALNRHRRESFWLLHPTVLFDGFSNQDSKSSCQVLAHDS